MKKKSTELNMKLARERFAAAADAESDQRARMLDAKWFRAGKQWPEHIERSRKQKGRPCLVVDRQNQFINQIVNEIKQNKTAPKATPVDDGADIETAEIIEGIYRKIERQSNANIARSWAADHAVPYGVGYYRIVTDYESEDSFDQDLYLRRIKHQGNVYFDPACQEKDNSDAGWAFIVEDLPRDEYDTEYADSELAGLSSFESIGDSAPGWISEHSVRVAEYFRIEKTKRELCVLVDGSQAYRDELPAEAQVIKSRKVDCRKVLWSKINGIEELESREWPGKYIPIVTMLGQELVIDGQTILTGMVEQGADAARQINYMRSAQVEAIALAPKAPFLAAVGQTEEFPEWKSANTENHAVLRWNPVTVGGQLIGQPSRSSTEPAIQAITMAVQQSVEDMKASYGMYDASLGNRSNETSGIAIKSRQREGDTASYHYFDNYNIALNFEARIIVDLIPKIYDRPGRVARIIGAEDEQEAVVLGEMTKRNGIQRIYDLSAGRYDIAIALSSSYGTQRAEAADAFVQLAGTMPIIGQAAPDIVIESLDVPGAQKLAKRLKKALPPGLAEEDNQQEQPIPPKVKQMLQQSGQMIDQLTQTVNQLQGDADTKRMEIDSRERIAFMQEETKRTIALAQIDSAQGLELLRQEVASVKHRLEMQYQADMAQQSPQMMQSPAIPDQAEPMMPEEPTTQIAQ